MTSNEIYEMFEKHNDDYLRFEKVKNKHSNRPDLHAFILLDKLFPSDNEQDIVSASTHNLIYLNIEWELLSKKLTEEIIHELVCCGISFNRNYGSLYSQL